MRFFIFTFLCLPFSAFVPFREPYVLGASALFFLAVAGMGVYLLWNVARRKRFWILDSSLFQVLCLGLCYWFLRVGFTQDFLKLLPPFCLGVLLFFFMVHAEAWEDTKFFLKRVLSWIYISVFLCFLGYQYFEISWLDLFGHTQFMGAWVLLFLPLLLGECKSDQKMLWAALILSVCFLLFWSHSNFLRFLTILNLLLAMQKFFFPGRVWIFNGTALLSGLGMVFFFGNKISDSFAQRFYLWESNLTAPIPFFGDPPFEAHYQRILNADLMDSAGHFKAGLTDWAQWAHNEGVHLLIEYGFPGLVLGLALAFLIFRHWIKYYKKNDPRMWFYGGLINLILYSVVSFPFHMPCSGIFGFILLLGLMFEDKREWRSVTVDFKKSSNFLFLEAGMLALFCLLILSGRNILALGYFTKGLQKKSLSISYLEKSVRLQPHSNLYTFALAKAYLNAGRLPEAEYWFAESCQQVPRVPTLHDLAACKDLQGKQEQAKDLYEKILRIHPLFTPAKQNLQVVTHRERQFGKGEKEEEETGKPFVNKRFPRPFQKTLS